jgi:hypothetical protein
VSPSGDRVKEVTVKEAQMHVSEVIDALRA